MTEVIKITAYKWADLEHGATRPVETPVAITDHRGTIGYYAWSPDGEGAYYYNSLAELNNNH